MPDRPGLDDNEALDALIGLWRDSADEIDRRLLAIWDRIRRELVAASTDGMSQNRLFRLRRQADRLESLGVEVQRIMDNIVTDARDWLAAGSLDEIYAAGAAITSAAVGAPFTFTVPHRAAMDVLSRDLFDDVLEFTRFVSDDAKRFDRVTGKRFTTLKIGTGDPVKSAARKLIPELEAGFRARGYGSVIYRDGSRHSFAEYGEMLLRTKTGFSYNAGTLNHARALDIRWFELLDGALCGLTFHEDPQLANGLIVDWQTAAGYPLSHPNCRRSINPRPDILGDSPAGAISVQAPESRADQAAFEAALRAQQAGRTRTRERRRRRARR